MIRKEIIVNSPNVTHLRRRLNIGRRTTGDWFNRRSLMGLDEKTALDNNHSSPHFQMLFKQPMRDHHIERQDASRIGIDTL